MRGRFNPHACKLPPVVFPLSHNIFVKSDDEAFKGATCVFHAAAEMGNLPDSTPMKVYEGGRAAIVPVMDSVKKSGTVR